MFQGSGFGTPSTSAPFGSFAKPATTGFATPSFGSTSTSLFGQTPQTTSGGLFGSTPTPAFGQTQNTQQSFGAFTSTTGGTGLFGSQQNATTSGTGLFGSTGTSAFGQTKPTFGNFNTPATGGGLFGQQLTTQAQTPSIFGLNSSTPATNLFGSSTGFGSTIGANTNTGTTVKFTAVTGTDTMVKNGVSQPISTRHHCITCMKEYETKSLEELRLEDYAANRKGPQQGVPNSGSLFSQPSLFGSTPGTTTTSGGLFGQTENKPLFGSTNTSLGFGNTGSVFGNTGGSLFGKPAATQPTAFGATATTTNTFSFNTATNTNPFGTNTAQVKPFGSVAPQTTLFGSNTAQPTTGFGQTQTSGFGTFGTQPTQNIGLFQQNKSPFGGTTTNTGFAFGQQSTPATTQATSLFGAKPATTGFGTTFGTPATGATTGFGGFGTQNTGSMFGNTFKPPTTGFSFGQTPTTSSTLGTGLNLGGGSLFTNNANKPGGLFGNTTGGGLFGSNTFGNTTNNTFGSGTTTGLGTSFSLGNNSMMGSNMFSTTGNNQVLQSALTQHLSESLAAMPFGDNPIFKKTLPLTGKTEELLKPPTNASAQKAMKTGINFRIAAHNQNKLKVKSLDSYTISKKGLFEGLEENSEYDNLFHVILPSPKRLDIKSRKENSALEDSNSNINESGKSLMSNQPKLTVNKFIIGKEGSLFQNWNSSVTSQNEDDNIKKSPANDSLNSPVLKNSSMNVNTSLGGTENTIAELCAKTSSPEALSESKDNAEQSSSSTSDSDDASEVLNNGPPHPAGIVLNRVGYYTIPSMEKLAKLVDSQGRCIVPNFTIGRYNYGNVFYAESFDVAGLNLDEIVHLRYREVVVYPDDEIKPPVGQGLNRPAQITLDRIWPSDKSTREPVSDPAKLLELKYEEKLRRVCTKNNSRFKEYRPQTGSWVFKVDHFSKYGLSDSDEDDDVSTTLTEAKKQRMNDAPPPSNFMPGPKELSLQKGLNGTWAPPPLPKTDEMVLDDDDDQDMEDGLIKTPFDLDENYQPTHTSPTMHFARELGASSNKVQLMKSSFFQDNDEDFNIGADYLDLRDGQILDFDDLDQGSKLVKSFPILRTQFTSNYKSATSSPVTLAVKVPNEDATFDLPPQPNLGPVALPLPPLHPQALTLRCPDSVIPYTKSIGATIDARCLADAALMKGRSFRARWSIDNTLLSLTTKHIAAETSLYAPLEELGEKLTGRRVDDMSPSIVQRIQIQGGQMENSILDFQTSLEQHLQIALEHSVQGVDENGCPAFAPKSGIDSIHAHCAYAQSLVLTETDPIFMTFCQVWELCIALWGNLPDLPYNVPVDSHQCVMERKRAVSDWFENVVSENVSEELDSQISASNVLTLVTGHCILKACEHAQQVGDHFLGLLLSQLGGNSTVQALVEAQLKQWIETQADLNIDTHRMKLMMLSAGIPVLQATDKEINVCQDLDWKRAFALHLWYICSPVSSVTDALLKYDDAFKETSIMYANPPQPTYCSKLDMEWEASSGKPVYDLCYHLLKLYSSRSYPLEPLLNPATYTADSLDYRLSWLISQMLESLGYTHLSEYSIAHVHTSFADQLQFHGLWHWAIFVLLHIRDPEKRKSAVLDVLNRHIKLIGDSEEEDSFLEKQERFLIDRLKLPEQWIYQAKTTYAISHKKYKQAAEYLIKAKQWNDSHSVIMQHLAAQAIIDEKYEYLSSLLKPLTVNGRSKEISGWNNQGSLIWDYLNIVQQVNTVVSKRDPSVGYELEKLQPQLSSICTRINLLPTPSAKHKLSQVEIAKRILHLVRTLLFLQKGGNEKSLGSNAHVVAHLVGQLPLPEDYAKQELQEIITSIISHNIL